jgi:hypothetical protein
MRYRYSCALTLFLAACGSVQAFSNGPPAQRAGVPGEANGATCTACHLGTPLNSDARGKLTIEAGDYKPGVKQTIRLILEHPEAMRWGFQMTIRLADNPLQGVGTFTANSLRRVVCSAGGPQPCPSGQNEFITHFAVSTFPGSAIGPNGKSNGHLRSTAMGNLTIYAAGNAANFSSNNQGDTIYNTNKTISPENCNLAKPTVSAVRNAASFLDGALALNTLIAIGGTGFQAAGTTRKVFASDILRQTVSPPN